MPIDCAFHFCSGLTSIYIGSGVSSIRAGAFRFCGSSNVEVASNNTTYYSENNYIIERITNKLIWGYTSRTIPDDIKEIGAYAFSGYNFPMSVIIPDGVTRIGDYAFEGCAFLKRITIPDSVTYIGTYAFNHCHYLSNIKIPNSVTSIGEYAFNDCPNLNNIVVEEGNKEYYSENNCIIERKSKLLIYGCSNSIIPNDVTSVGDASFCFSNLTKIVIPDGVTHIGDSAFEGCSKLVSVIIPNSVTSIGENAFKFCDSLKYNEYDNACYLGNNDNPYLVLVKAKDTSISSCIINDKTKIIYDDAFLGCKGLIGITIPDGVISIGHGAFYNCYNLISLSIPNSIVIIGSAAFSGCNLKYNEYDNAYYLGNSDNPYLVLIEAKNMDILSCLINEGTKIIYNFAFGGCEKMTGVIIPDSVISIGDRAFSYCSGLNSLRISKYVLVIGQSVFMGCSGLERIVVSVDNYSYKSINNCLIDKENKILMVGCKNSVIPSDGSVTNIGYGAFYNCKELTDIVIPMCITYIDDFAFFGSGLTEITIPNNVINLGSLVFASCSELTNVIMPAGLTIMGDGMFANCVSLTSIIFNGIKGKWQTIIKGDNWRYRVPEDCVVHCTDGDIKI